MTQLMLSLTTGSRMRKANDVEMKYRERVTSWIMTDVYLDSLVTYVDHARFFLSNKGNPRPLFVYFMSF